VENLKGSQAESNEYFRIEFGIGAFEQGMELMVEADLPAEYAENQGRGQIAIGCGKCVDGFAAEQVVGVGVAVLDGHENLEGGFASRGNI
jgi:hypothetical protein